MKTTIIGQKFSVLFIPKSFHLGLPGGKKYDICGSVSHEDCCDAAVVFFDAVLTTQLCQRVNRVFVAVVVGRVLHQRLVGMKRKIFQDQLFDMRDGV